MKILVISPHTDDAELGTGGTINKFINQGDDLYWIVLSIAEESVIGNRPRNIHKTEFLNVIKLINFSKELLIFFTLIGIIGIFTFFLTDSAINLAHALGIAPIIIAFTVIAAATSIPDTIISVVNAKKGNIDDATSNVFGSNIFDILVGLGLPLFIYSLYKGAVEITFTNIEIVLSLLGSTMLVLYFFGDDHTLCKKEAAVLLIMYFIFVAYVISLAVI